MGAARLTWRAVPADAPAASGTAPATPLKIALIDAGDHAVPPLRLCLQQADDEGQTLERVLSRLFAVAA